MDMSIFDEIKNAIGAQSGARVADDHSGLVQAALQMFGNRAGLSSLGQDFESAGLGHVFGSWVGTGANQPVSPQELQTAIGSDRIQQLAVRAGIPARIAPQLLATVLPMVVDKLTPRGQIPQHDSEIQRAS
jgi:uncharacterized protein YidB (DUF937 family)